MSRVQIIITGLVLSILLPVISCSAGEKPQEKQARLEVSDQDSKTVVQASWQQEWEKTLSEARKESSVVILMSGGTLASTRQELMDIIKSKYGLTLDIKAGPGGLQAAKVIQEARAGLFLTDIYTAGSQTIVLNLKPEGLLQPMEPLLILPEVKDPKAWFEGDLPFIDKDRIIMGFSAYIQQGLAYNADYVSKEELQSYRDLLAPKFKGKMAISDPTVAGAGSAFASTIGLRVMGIDWLKELVKQDVTTTRDLRLLVEWLARGKYYIAMGAAGLLGDVQKAGVRVYEHSPKEGGFLTTGRGSIAVFKKAAHPNATRIFVNWLLSREGQTIYSKGIDQQSARLDVPTDFLTPSVLRQPGVKQFDARPEEFELARGKDEPVLREIFTVK